MSDRLAEERLADEVEDAVAGAVPRPIDNPELAFETPENILTGDDEVFDPVIENLAYRGLKTLVVGQSKAGKSFTTWILVADSVRRGNRFLYLTEEPKATVEDKIRKFGLAEAGDRFLVVRRSAPDIVRLNWVEIAKRIATTARNRAVDCVVVDTARAWFGLQSEESNSADVIGRAFDLLAEVCDGGAAIVVLHQAPWDKARARNSTEFHASSDLIFVIKGEGKNPRGLKYLGGRVEDVHAEQTIRWAGGQGEDLGETHRCDTRANLDRVLKCLEVDRGRKITAEQISDEVEMHKKTVLRCLDRLEKGSKVVREHGEPTPGEGRTPDLWSRAGYFFELSGQAEGGDDLSDQD